MCRGVVVLSSFPPCFVLRPFNLVRLVTNVEERINSLGDKYITYAGLVLTLPLPRPPCLVFLCFGSWMMVHMNAPFHSSVAPCSGIPFIHAGLKAQGSNRQAPHRPRSSFLLPRIKMPPRDVEGKHASPTTTTDNRECLLACTYLWINAPATLRTEKPPYPPLLDTSAPSDPSIHLSITHQCKKTETRIPTADRQPH